MAPLLHETADAGIGFQVRRIHPRELVPDLQVADIRHRELAGGRGGRASLLTLAKEFPVPRVGVDHPPAGCVEAVADQERALFVGQVLGGPEADLEMPIARPAIRERLELHEQRRYEVERQADVGKFAEQGRHPVVVLERVEAHPGQDVLPRHQILVERLMLMPQQGDASLHVLR